jgi:putative Ca2+/H+ antiporter (TMEM165/GDT1 family)
MGDETFIIAAIMAMRNPRLIVFTGAISALIVMTVLQNHALVRYLLFTCSLVLLFLTLT